ncbi:MAG: hypothetical protein IAI50_11415, partial [Candidatus Eremiobacteraeota bacterium]|nr:hypothetical protein [Candidatus Eremiobacteraeota bacterium]
MTTLPSRVRLRLGALDDGFVYWGARASAYAAIVCLTVTSLPDGPALASSRWFAMFAPHLGLTFALAAAALAALVAFACTEQRARLRGGRALGLVAAVVAALCSLDALRAGGGALSAAFAAAIALLLERRGTPQIVGAAIVTIVWCNLSPVGII